MVFLIGVFAEGFGYLLRGVWEIMRDQPLAKRLVPDLWQVMVGKWGLIWGGGSPPLAAGCYNKV